MTVLSPDHKPTYQVNQSKKRGYKTYKNAIIFMFHRL